MLTHTKQVTWAIEEVSLPVYYCQGDMNVSQHMPIVYMALNRLLTMTVISSGRPHDLVDS